MVARKSSTSSSKSGKGNKNKASQQRKGKKKEPVVEDDNSSSEEEEPEPIVKKVIKQKKGKKEESSSDASDNDSDGSDDDSDEEPDAKEFTDDNAKWLKAKSSSNKKSQLLSSDSEDNDDDDDDKSGDDEEDSDDELLEVERQAAQLDDELAQEQKDAAAEFQRTIAEETAIYELPTSSEWETASEDRLVPPSELRSHMTSILEVLADFKVRRQPDRARSEYMEWLVKCSSELYGYIPELVEYFCTMFAPAEAMEFLSASDKPRPLVIRTNTLKARRKDLAAALMKRGVTLDPLASWSKVGLKIVESPVPIGATPEYLSGHYMLQSAASMCPVLALHPQPHDRVLDMSAAPGGKTSYIAQLMRNTGVIVANDLKAERQKATVANLHRLGVHNCVSCTHDGRSLGQRYPNRFDRILLDAPCSGLGVISRDPSVKVQRTVEDLKNCAHLQKELLLAAIDALKVYKPKHDSGNNNDEDGSGTMVYSTCSVAVFENEEVVNYALSKRDIKIVNTGLEFGKPGFVRYQNKRFHPSVALTRRFYPHVHNMDGFYVAKIVKLSDRRPEDTLEEEDPAEEEMGETNNTKKMSTTQRRKAQDEAAAGDAISKKKKKKTKKIIRKRKPGDDGDDANAEQKNKPKHSVPPVKIQSSDKRQKTNAKVTKPRRKRAAADA